MDERGCTVLIIDDAAEDRLLYRGYLAGGHAVLEAENGEQGLALYREHRPECLLVDYRLPTMNGLQVVEALTQEFGEHACAIVLLTTLGHPDVAVQALKSGAHDYLDKDHLTPKGLRRALAEAREKVALNQARRQAEARLHESEQRLTLALEAAAMGVWVWDLRTQRVTWSPELYQVFGVETFDGTPEGFGRFLHPEDADCVWATVNGAVRDRAPYEAEFRILRGDGAVRWVANRGRAAYDAGGRPVRMLGVAMDITARKQAEEHVRESEARFRTLAQSLPALVFVTDADGMNVFTNERFQRYAGRAADSLLGAGWLDILHPDDREQAARAWAEAVARGEPYEAQYRFRRHDGSYRWFLCQGMPLRAEAGRITRWYGTCVDIEDSRRAEAALQELNATLEQRVAERTAALERAMAERQRLEGEARRAEHFALLGRLAAGVSHELRNPLGAVFLNVDLLAEELARPVHDSAEAIAESLAEIKTNLARVEDLMEDYLSLVRVGALERRVQDLGAAAQDWAAEFQALAATRGMTLRAEGLATLGAVEFHASTLRRALLNLVQNALDAMPPGGTISLIGTGTADRAEIQVRDTGCGMPAERLQPIFEPLYTTKPGGTGLGLYIVQQIVTAHGGQLAVESVEGQGTTFTIALPRPAVGSSAAREG